MSEGRRETVLRCEGDQEPQQEGGDPKRDLSTKDLDPGQQVEEGRRKEDGIGLNVSEKEEQESGCEQESEDDDNLNRGTTQLSSYLPAEKDVEDP